MLENNFYILEIFWCQLLFFRGNKSTLLLFSTESSNFKRFFVLFQHSCWTPWGSGNLKEGKGTFLFFLQIVHCVSFVLTFYLNFHSDSWQRREESHPDRWVEEWLHWRASWVCSREGEFQSLYRKSWLPDVIADSSWGGAALDVWPLILSLQESVSLCCLTVSKDVFSFHRWVWKMLWNSVMQCTGQAHIHSKDFPRQLIFRSSRTHPRPGSFWSVSRTVGALPQQIEF